MRVVLDTNILVSALISPAGPSDRLYQEWRNRRFDLVTCEEQLDEFRRVTRYPRLRQHIDPADAGTMLNEIKLLAVMVTNLPKLKVSRDPGDNFVIAMALAGRADYLITGDKSGILAIKRHQQTRIVAVSQFLDILET